MRLLEHLGNLRDGEGCQLPCHGVNAFDMAIPMTMQPFAAIGMSKIDSENGSGKQADSWRS